MEPSSNSTFSDELSFDVALFIASEESTLSRFLSESGASIDDLKTSLTSKETQAALLDFILSDDEMIQRFCLDKPYAAEEIWKARRNLPGFMTWDSI